MPVEIIGMRGAITGGTEDAAAQVDIPTDGTIIGIDCDLNAALDADSELAESELSFIATNQLSTNDVRGRLASISVVMTLTTSGIALVSLQKFVGPTDIPVAGGERLFIHIISTAGVTGTVRYNVHLDVRTVGGRRSARRR